MKNILAVICLLTGQHACAKAPKIEHEPTVVPTNIARVSTEVVGDTVVRVIQHNMEMKPLLQVEILQRPDLSIAHTLVLDAVVMEGQKYLFSAGSGAYIEGVDYGDDDINFEIEYFPLQGESQIYQCRLPIIKSEFGAFSCVIAD